MMEVGGQSVLGHRPRLRLLATVTFNPNQLRAHLEPILDLDEVEEVVLVSDTTPPPMPKLRAVVPPRILVRLLGRAGAKAIVASVQARRLRPDWVLGFNLVPHGLNAVLAARAGAARSMYVMIGGPMEWEGGGWQSDNNILRRQRRPSLRLERLLLRAARRATVTVTMGTAGRDALVARGIEPARIVPIPASVDLTRFQPGEDEARWDVITVAALHPRKRLHDLIEATATLAADGSVPRVALVGCGALRDDLVAHAQALGVHGNIDFLGFRLDTPELLRQARVFVLPSREEGLSIALLEAMASGLPVVASDVGEARDVVRSGLSGFLYPEGDVHALASYVSRLLGDVALRTRMGREARRIVVDHASRSVVSAAYRAVLMADAIPGRAADLQGVVARGSLSHVYRGAGGRHLAIARHEGNGWDAIRSLGHRVSGRA